MGKTMETVVYYNPGTPETIKHVPMMKGVLVQMGVRIKNVAPDQVMETVGYLAGMNGFQARGREKKEEAGDQGPGVLPEIPVEMMVLKQFSGRRLDELFLNLRKAGVPKINLKAVLTEHNSVWTFYHLYEELREEHEAIGGR